MLASFQDVIKPSNPSAMSSIDRVMASGTAIDHAGSATSMGLAVSTLFEKAGSHILAVHHNAA